MGPSASNSGPQAEQARDQQYHYTQDHIVRHCSNHLEDIAPRRRPTRMTVKRAKTIVRDVPVEKRTGKDKRKMPQNPLFDPFGLGRADVCRQRKQFLPRCASCRALDLSIARHQREIQRRELGIVFATLLRFDCGTSAGAMISATKSYARL
jgi:hypothetical protein